MGKVKFGMEKIIKKKQNSKEDEEYFEKCYKDALEFIRQMYCGNQRNNDIYVHITCATDRDNIQKVFDDVQNIRIKGSLDLV